MDGLFSTYYISLSIFLAYALTYPEMRGDAVFCDSDQDEVDGSLLCADCRAEYYKLLYEMAHGMWLCRLSHLY